MSTMASPPDAPKPTLADLRREIDRIDEAMHRLLMERGDIIDTLIATKKTVESGSAPGALATVSAPPSFRTRSAGRYRTIFCDLRECGRRLHGYDRTGIDEPKNRETMGA